MKTLNWRLLVVCLFVVVCSASFAEQKFITLAYHKPVGPRNYWKTLAEMQSPEPVSWSLGLRYEHEQIYSAVPVLFENADIYSLPGERFMSFDTSAHEGGGKYGEDLFSYTPIRRGIASGGVVIFSKYPLQVSGIQPDDISIAFSFNWKLR